MSVSHESTPVSPTKLRYEEYVLFPNDGKRHEIIDGRHFMNPAPIPYHQSVAGRIYVQLFGGVEDNECGTVYHAPIDVQLSDFDVVQPDIVVVLAGNRIITPTKIKGSPDLVVEVLSPSTRKNDEQLKKQLYQQHAVPEYWIVDSDEKAFSQFLLNGQHVYGEAIRCTDSITFRGIPDGVNVDLTKVW